MNSRITLVSDTEVKIKHHATATGCTTLTIEGCHIRREGIGFEYWDDQGLEAWDNASNCFRQTGSFAALSDESAVPWVGKRCRWKSIHGDIYDVEVVSMLEKTRLQYISSSAIGYNFIYPPDTQLLPLIPPKPKLRKWTAREAFREVPPGTRLKYGTEIFIVSSFEYWSGGWQVRLTNHQLVSAEQLAEHYTKLSGSPCGVVEE